MDIWQLCAGEKNIQALQHQAWRVVEGQHTGSGTRKLVATLEEHEVLEQELDSSKPKLSQNEEFKGLHYLLYTEFRYPPLKWGSRFGTRQERSIWYGSLDVKTMFAEKAFYQLAFFKAVREDVLKSFSAQKTVYTIKIDTTKGVALDKPPFAQHQKLISKKDSWQCGQAIGFKMRERGVQAFSYSAARTEKGTNIGVFTPRAFANKAPKANAYQSWDCYNDGIHVEFTKTTGLRRRYAFKQDDFLVAGRFPFDHDNA
jgi:hypothetical protein